MHKLYLSKDVLIDKIDDTYILYSTSKSEFFSFNNKIAMDICDMIYNGINYDTLIDSLLKKYIVEKDVLINDVDNMLNKMKNLNILCEDSI